MLATAVICWHSSPLPGLSLLNADLAVEAFFVISGFYMALILESKYSSPKDGHWLFYSNRALRIFPMYYATLSFCLLIYAAGSLHVGHPVDRLVYWQQAVQLGEWIPLALLALTQLEPVPSAVRLWATDEFFCLRRTDLGGGGKKGAL
jgi:peptidoglycan/LPS O-acetylase OafA/YrhL